MFVSSIKVATPSHEVIPLVHEEIQEFGDQREIVGIIGIPHNQIFPMCIGEPLDVGMAVSSTRLVNDSRA